MRILLSAMVALSGSVYAQNPVIFSVDRTNAAPREIVTLHGSDFGTDRNDVRVFFGGTRAQIRSISNQLMEVQTPTGATFDPIRVVNVKSGRSATAPGQFFLNYQGEPGISSVKFSAQSDFQAESGLYDLCLCDFNDDNRVDVATASTNSNQVTVFQNTSTPGTISLTGLGVAVGAHTLHVKCGDLNGDGRPDIILSEASNGGRVFVLTNDGNFSFSVQAITLAGIKVKQLGISDLDLDGRPDLVVTNTGDNVLTILPNTSAAATSFGSPIHVAITGALSTDALAIGDLDADGYPEIVTSQYQADSGNKLYILRNLGSFNLGNIDVIMVNKAVSNIRLADLNADSKPDITIARLTGSEVSVYLNNSASTLTFGDPQSFITETLPVGIDFSDFDGDGKLDVAVGSIAKSVSVLNNLTSGSGVAAFAPVVKLGATYINRNLKNADLDGDGKPDIVFTSVDDFSGVPTPSSKISVLRNLSCMVPRITPGGPLEVCIGAPLQLKATGGGGITYQWRLEGNAAPVKSGIQNFLDVTEPGIYKVVALSGPPSCSKESASVEVTFSAPTTSLSATDPDARSNSPVCTDNILQLTVNDVGASAYRWRGPGGFEQTTASITAERNGFAMEHAGLYIVEMMAGTCVAKTDSTLVESITVPEFAISYAGTDKFCADGSKTLTVSPFLASGFSYQWYEKNSGLIDEATAETFIAHQSGEYYAVVTPAQTGCQPRQTATLLLSTVARPTAAFEVSASGCVGEAIAFTQRSTGDPGTDLLYTWTFGDGQSSGEASPAHSFAQPTTFEVGLKVFYAGLEDCSATTQKMIEVFTGVKPEILAGDTELCPGESVSLSVTGSFADVRWSTQETTAEITATTTGSYSVVTHDAHGCAGEDEIYLAAKPLPELQVNADRQSIAAGQVVRLEATGADVYVWSPGKTLNDSTIANPEASPIATTTYVVTGSQADGCEATASITIQVAGEVLNISVPALFSPNGDSENEILIIDGVENYGDCSFVVFDKRGARVFAATGYQNNWDGTYHGAPLPEGVYYYVFGCPNSKAKTGTVTILR